MIQMNPLSIDSISFSTYYGGSNYEAGEGITMDSQGNIYVTGFTSSTDFPVTNESFSQYHGLQDCYVLKFDSSGKLVYSTLIGGSGPDYGNAIEVDSLGNVYVAGTTGSADFPTVNAFNSTYAGRQDCFVFKLNPSGDELLFSTYIGGYEVDLVLDMALDLDSNVYVTGVTHYVYEIPEHDFPVTEGAFDTTYNGDTHDAYAFKLDSSGSFLHYCTFFGGEGGEWGEAITVDDEGCAYVAGQTDSELFPTVNAFNDNYTIPDDWWGNTPDCFVLKLNQDGSDLIYSTYVGGVGSDYPKGIAVDEDGNAWVTGVTNSHDFPGMNSHSYDATINGGWSDAFVFKLGSEGDDLLYSTFIGGSDHDETRSLIIDSEGDILISGFTRSEDFPTLDAYDDSLDGGHDGFILKLDQESGEPIYSTLIGGSGQDKVNEIVVDEYGSLYITCTTWSSDIEIQNGHSDAFNGGETDCFISKLGDNNTSIFSTIAIVTTIIGIICITVILFKKYNVR